MLMKPWRTASDMAEPAWQAEHCVDTSASREFVWAYMSNVGKWDDPPAQFVLEGPFKWSFADLAGRTRLTQHVVLEGQYAATYLPIVQQTFAVSLRPGMERIAASIYAAYTPRK